MAQLMIHVASGLMLLALGGCVTRQASAPLREPEPGVLINGSPTFIETELDRNLPIPGPMVSKLCERLQVPASCAALYQMTISSGTTDTLASWQREDLNFHLDCLPQSAKAFLRSCQNQEIREGTRETACWNLIGMTRARLIEVLLEEDERPETASLKEAHALFTKQFEPEKNSDELAALIERILARDPSNLDAHRVRVQMLAPLVIKGQESAAYENSLRWLLASSAAEHRVIAWQAQILRLEVALAKNPSPEALQELQTISQNLKKLDPSNAWTLRSLAILAFYGKERETALQLMQKAVRAPEADAIMGEELKKIGSRAAEPFEPRIMSR